MAKHSYEDVAAALGELCIKFQGLEFALGELLWPFVNPNDQRVATIIGSQLSFSKLCDVIDALCRYRTSDARLLETLKGILRDCGRLEGERNTYIHSYYEINYWGPDGITFERSKQKIKRGKGYRPDFEIYDPIKLNVLSTEMGDLLMRIYAFTEQLREEKVIPPEPYVESPDESEYEP
jgi:hypothetical protein